MKATRPQKATASEHSYRSAAATPTVTAPDLKALAEAALALLAREGANPGGRSWNATREMAGEFSMEIICTGPDLPSTVPADTAHPADILEQRPWVGSHRLVVGAPLVVFDICWRPDAPLRIMNFSRGDWEGELLESGREQA